MEEVGACLCKLLISVGTSNEYNSDHELWVASPTVLTATAMSGPDSSATAAQL